jgi:DNA repair protein RecO (recombination protein O)
MICTTDAIVLKTMKYRESSMIATLLTRDYGKLSVIAKGIRNRPKGGGSVLEPMNYVRVVLYRKPGRELQLMTQCEQVRNFRGLSEDLKRMGVGMAAVEITNLAMGPDEPHPEVFELIVDTLKALNGATGDPQNALYYFEIRMLGLLGFRPELRRCVMCEGPLPSSSGAERIQVSLGAHGAVCPSCEDRGHGEMSIPLPALNALAAFQDTPEAEGSFRIVLSAGMRTAIENVLRRLVMHHLTGMRPLQSQQVFSVLT